MKVKIEPRKSTDRGGYYCMPLCSNVPAYNLSGVWSEMLADPAG